MISVKEADKLISKNLIINKSAKINYINSSGEVLDEALVADRNYPPFDRVAMDGIAINYKAIQEGLNSFKIEGVTRAGEPQSTLLDDNNCLEVMTGGVLPIGCDVVIRYEDIQIENGEAKLIDGLEISKMQNVHLHGSDYQEGDLLLEKGFKIEAPQMAVLTSIGKDNLQTMARPKIAIVSTGDELIDVEETPLAHQIRRSNVYTIYSALKLHGFSDVEILHVKDEKEVIFDKLEQVLKEVDVLILSGGVSKGKFDYIPEVLADLKVNKIFHKIKQKPGKPMWFGTRQDNKMVFGLPGNPTSALICFRRYVLPALWKSIKTKAQPKFARLTNEVNFKKPMTYFLPVSIDYTDNGVISAAPVKTNGSGDFNSVAKSDGFIELTAEKNVFNKGESYPLYLWKEL